MLVSVIIPVYNTGKYLTKCLDSVLNQKYQELEIIVVNDGSTDDSQAIINQYCEKDSRIISVIQENGGLSAARNTGLDIASGEVIYFLDSDDSIRDGLLKECVQELILREADMVSFNYELVDEQTGSVIRTTTYPEGAFEVESNEDKERFLLHEVFGKGLSWESWGRVFRRSVIEENHLRFYDNNIIFAEDLYFFLLFIMHARRVASVQGVYYRYLKRENSIMAFGDRVQRVMKMVELSRILDCELYQRGRQIDFYAILNYEIINNAVQNALRVGALKISEFRSTVVIPLKENVFYSQTLKRAKIQIRKRNNEYGIRRGLTNYFWCCFYYTGNTFYLTTLNTIRRMAGVFRLWTGLKHQTHKLMHKELRKLYKTKGRNRVVILHDTEYSNYGDHAISLAEEQFITKELGISSDYIVAFSTTDWNRYGREIKKGVLHTDLLVFPGGGQIGTLWPGEWTPILEMLESFPDNPIVFFPQTAYFSNDSFGETEITRFVNIVNMCNNLTIFARDKATYKILIRDIGFAPNRCYLVPDIVTYLRPSINEIRRKEILIILRQDKEKTIESPNLERIIAEHFPGYSICYSDMIGESYFYRDTRKEEVEKKLREYASAALVVTDRLHGMLFSALTSTPCIALDNKSRKVSGQYEWISYLPYIHLAEEQDVTADLVEKMLLLGSTEYQYNNEPLRGYYEQMATIIRENGGDIHGGERG